MLMSQLPFCYFRHTLCCLVTAYCSIFLHLSSGDNYTEFKGLSPEEAKTKLAQLIKDEVDLNKDGVLTEDEIRQRFHVTTKEYRKKEVMETMKQHDEGEPAVIRLEFDC